MRNTFLTESGDVRWERISELMGTAPAAGAGQEEGAVAAASTATLNPGVENEGFVFDSFGEAGGSLITRARPTLNLVLLLRGGY